LSGRLFTRGRAQGVAIDTLNTADELRKLGQRLDDIEARVPGQRSGKSLTCSMIIVFAQEHDESAKSLVRAGKVVARLMVPADLSRAGWSCTSRDPASSHCVIEGVRPIHPKFKAFWSIAASWLDLPHIASSDRSMWL